MSFLFALTVLASFCMYFLPWGLAVSRDHHQRTAIGLLNLLLGWTVLGWIISIVWAGTATTGRVVRT